MALFIKQRKEKKVRADHPVFSSGEPKKLVDQDRERDLPKVRRNLIAIIAVMVLIAILIIVAIVMALSPASTTSTTKITAADTFAISSYEQQGMAQKTEDFAEYILIWAYCSDQDAALKAKNAALSMMVPGTNAYKNVEAASQVYPVIAPENFVPIVTEPLTSNSGITIASSLTFTCDGAAADISVKSENNPNGTFADPGIAFTVTFEKAQDEAIGATSWMISDVSMKSKTTPVVSEG